jgi:cytochrome-b5 reductase
MCELVIKAYPTGKVSSYLHSLHVGDFVEVKGPLPKFKYTPNMKKKIGMVAGGSGITPMVQVLREIVKNPSDLTEVHLVFANNTEDDILLKSLLDDIVCKHPRVKVTYVVAAPSAQWTGAKGYVNADILRRTMPQPGEDVLLLVCGPPGFMEAVSGNKTPDYKQGAVSGLLKKAGYTGKRCRL